MLWQDIASRLKNLAVKVRHVDAHIPKGRATEEHRNNEQVDQAAKTEMAQWAHDTSGHQGRDATYRWITLRAMGGGTFKYWKFTPEQVQDPEELVKYLEKVCCHPGSSREIQITATCWGLAHAYRALFDTTQYPQGEEKVSRTNNKTMSTAATQTSATGAAAPPGPARSIAGTQTLATGTVTPPAPAIGGRKTINSIPAETRTMLIL